MSNIATSSQHNCTSQVYYLGSAEDSICVWQHSPESSHIKNKIILLCPPVGYEHVHAYRSLRRLEERLCAAGYIVFRFDYAGTGDSSGSVFVDDCINQWTKNISTLSQFITDIYPDIKQCWLGLRLGATLAALADKSQSVDTIILWEPIIKARRYIRELEAISLMSSANKKDDSVDYLESAGFCLAKASIEKIKKINLLEDAQIPNSCSVLHLARDDKPIDNSLIDTLNLKGIETHLHNVDGYVDMMAEPHDTKTPLNAIDYLTEWLDKQSSTINIKTPIHLPTDLLGLQATNILQLEDKSTEQAFYFGETSSLFGILTCPESSGNNKLPCIILANSGSVHHVGPNDVYTLIARKMAAIGYPVFRMDLENIGDSKIVQTDLENVPYQPNAIENIRSAIKFLQKQTEASKFIISGICSGAHTTFHAALQLENMNIIESLIINPLAFYWEPGMSLETPSTLEMFRDQSYYKESLRNLDKWKKLFTGKANIAYIGQFVLKRLIKLINQIWKNNRSLILGEHTPLALDLTKIRDSNIAISFIFSSTDPGLDLVHDQAKRTFKKGIKENWIDVHVINDADHTFSKKIDRDNLISVLTGHLNNTYKKIEHK